MTEASPGASRGSDSGSLPRASGLGRFLRATVAQLLPLVFRTRLVGIPNVPEGGVLLAGNHQSYLDPILLWIRFPRVIHFVGKGELWGNPLFAWVLRNVGALPIDRASIDRKAIMTATALADQGEPVGIFPEGTRVRGELGAGSEGAAFIATRADVPIVPVGIVGTDKVMPPGARIPRFPRVTIALGEPLYPSEYTEGGRKERITRLTQDVMHAIAEEIGRAEGGRT